jgi:hypothetical protein
MQALQLRSQLRRELLAAGFVLVSALNQFA